MSPLVKKSTITAKVTASNPLTPAPSVAFSGQPPLSGEKQQASESALVDPCRAGFENPTTPAEDFIAFLEACRCNFKEMRPRLSEFDRLRLRPRQTLYDQVAPGLKESVDDWDALLDSGRLVWGGILMVNKFLFESDCGCGDDHPGLVVYSLDPWFDGHPEELLRMATFLFNTAETLEKDERACYGLAPELMAVCRKINDFMTPVPDHPVPSQLTNGRDVRLKTIQIQRVHLPERKIAGSLFPLLVAPERCKSAGILPSIFWPEKFLRHQKVSEAAIRLRQRFSPPDLAWLVEQLRGGSGFTSEELDLAPGASRIRHFLRGRLEEVCESIGFFGEILLVIAGTLYTPAFFRSFTAPDFLRPWLDWLPQLIGHVWSKWLGLPSETILMAAVLLTFAGLLAAVGGWFVARRAHYCRFVDFKEGFVGQRLEIEGFYAAETTEYRLADVLLLFLTVGPCEADVKPLSLGSHSWWDMSCDELGSTNRYENGDSGGSCSLEALLGDGRTLPFFRPRLSRETGPTCFIARRWADILGLKWLRRDIRPQAKK